MEILTIKDICEKYSLSQTALAKRFDIPLRTVQNWAGGQRSAPNYVIKMILELLEADKNKAQSHEISKFNS